jgi:hypothetical protein
MIAAAVRNNAEWCDAVCRAHGIAGEAGDDAWTWPERTPPYYPDAVTLRPDVDVASLLERIDSGPGCSIKDSFATIEVPGFEVLIEASWICRPPGRAPEVREEWTVVSAEELAGAQFLTARRDGRITEEAILNRTGDVVGISNVSGEDPWPGAVATAVGLYPDLPLVGYERGDDLAAARRVGFEVIGPLRVWMRPG